MPAQHTRRSVRVRVLRVARHSPHLTAAQIAAIAGCHRSTARKHLRSSGTALPLAGSSARQDCAAADGAAPQVLMLLSRGSDGRERWSAASNARCPPSALARLASDPAEYVRYAVASHPSGSRQALSRLALDLDEGVRAAAACRRSRRRCTRGCG